MKFTPQMKIKLAFLLAGVLGFGSCSSQPYSYQSAKVIEAKEEIGELTSFIVLGSTFMDEVESVLGDPSYLVPEAQGKTAHIFVWKSSPYVVMAKDGEGQDTYDPFGSRDGEGPIEEEAYLFLLCDSMGRVQEMSIQGPPEG